MPEYANLPETLKNSQIVSPNYFVNIPQSDLLSAKKVSIKVELHRASDLSSSNLLTQTSPERKAAN